MKQKINKFCDATIMFGFVVIGLGLVPFAFRDLVLIWHGKSAEYVPMLWRAFGF